MVMFASLAQAGTPKANLRVQVLDQDKIKIITSSASGEIKVLLKDVTDRPVFEEQVNTRQYARVLDLSHLPTGQYTLETMDNSRLEKISIMLTGDEIRVASDAVVYLPTFRLNQESLYVSLFPNQGKATVIIRDANAKKLVTKKLDTSQEQGKIFNFEQMPAGKYTVTVVTDDYELSKELEVQ